jgi:hypothetical protein
VLAARVPESRKRTTSNPERAVFAPELKPESLGSTCKSSRAIKHSSSVRASWMSDSRCWCVGVPSRSATHYHWLMRPAASTAMHPRRVKDCKRLPEFRDWFVCFAFGAVSSLNLIAARSRKYAIGGEHARPGRCGWRPASHIWDARIDSPFGDHDGARATRRGRRLATPGAGVLPNSNCSVTA